MRLVSYVVTYFFQLTMVEHKSIRNSISQLCAELGLPRIGIFPEEEIASLHPIKLDDVAL